MIVEVLEEAFYDQARYGMLLSFGATSGIKFRDFIQSYDLQIQADKVMKTLKGRGGGHDEFLKHICVSLYTNMPLSWWTHMDQYQYSPDQSESKMHTLMKGELTFSDFTSPVDEFFIDAINEKIRNKDFDGALENLPFGFLQARTITTNYMCLRNIYQQRKRHKHKAWKYFCPAIKAQLEHPEFLEWKEKRK